MGALRREPDEPILRISHTCALYQRLTKTTILMKKQQKYSIVMDLQNRYSVVLRYTGIAVYQSENRGQAGLEDCQDWLAKQPED